MGSAAVVEMGIWEKYLLTLGQIVSWYEGEMNLLQLVVLQRYCISARD